MKKYLHLLLAVALLTTSALAADTPISGSNGGKILSSVPLHAEFFVQPDRKVSITFYDEALKQVGPAGQEIKVIAEASTGKVALEFEKSSTGYISKTALPAGDGYRIVVQIKNDATAKPQNFRVDFHTEICKECGHPEYACTCAHAASGDHSGHGH